ncbi:ABC transporter permease [Komagataeibacter xylinus]|uniref:ABC transporter permease n=1 Tax=Komagataeibacter xylinus TaxID=28448 RepID=A0A857FRB5_KOMXY|nr:ABC transporter permease [Komagataeibacter xylinus]QHC36059.1 ABC transporter permease [Komagataeibacter xylinus]
MSRFVTLFFAMVAAVSGLFLYNKKQQTTALDHQIAQIVEQTERTRAQTAMLRAEWAMLNQPDRLGTLASRYDKALQPVAPTQFVQMSALSAHLPPVGMPSHHPVPAPRATMVATLAADHAAPAPVHEAVAALPAIAAPAATPAHVEHAMAAPSPRHSEPAAQHDGLAHAMAQIEPRAPVHAAPEHARQPERMAAAEPVHLPPSPRESMITPARMAASDRPRSQNIAEAAWHPTAPPRMGGSSLGTPHVTSLPPPVPVNN